MKGQKTFKISTKLQKLENRVQLNTIDQLSPVKIFLFFGKESAIVRLRHVNEITISLNKHIEIIYPRKYEKSIAFSYV